MPSHHRRIFTSCLVCALLLSPGAFTVGADDGGFVEERSKLGTIEYDAFETANYCGASCHTDIYRQWQQAMMSQCYTHHWDEIEYFELAVPHAERDARVAEVKAGCNGCHAPFSFLAGDVPPPRPEEGSMANESVSCDLCHTAVGIAGDTAYNFNLNTFFHSLLAGRQTSR